MSLKTMDSKWYRGLNSPGARLLSISLTFLFLFMTTIPCFAQDSPPEPDIFSMEQAEALIAEGLAAEALKMLEKLEPEMKAPEQQIKFYLLKIRAHLALGEKNNAESAVREIYKKNLAERIQMSDLENDTVFLFEKIKAEYWFVLKEEKKDEEAFDRLVIEQHGKKPKKKSILPKLIVGTLLAGALVAAVLMFTSGSTDGGDTGDYGILKFENCNYWDVSIEINSVVKNVPGTRHNRSLLPPVNFAYVKLPPGTHTLTVTSTQIYSGETKVFVYSINITLGIETHFLFFHD
jgi:hypothetical protein